MNGTTETQFLFDVTGHLRYASSFITHLMCCMLFSFLICVNLGLFEGTIVSCKVVDELPTLDTVYVTAANQKDWEMLVNIALILLLLFRLSHRTIV